MLRDPPRGTWDDLHGGHVLTDFLLDFRPPGRRTLSRVAEGLRFGEGTTTLVVERPQYGLVIAQSGDPSIWLPYRTQTGTLVAIAGRLAFDESEWGTARGNDGSGGHAAEVVHGQYRTHGLGAFGRLNGNAVVVVCDEQRGLLHLVTDRCGVLPAFEVETPEGRLYGSHPDVLADAAGERHRIDEVSLAEFILSGTVTPPFSYYERIRAVDHGTILTFDLAADRPLKPAMKRYFEFSYRGDARVPEQELTNQLADALRRAVQRRTLPRLGATAVALSGGLDSRIIVASAGARERIFAFTCYDAPNRELRTAEAIARALSVRFLPLQRPADYYAAHAEQGVRISGAMGSFANNHFLGVIPRLKHEGMESLLTGCYCDYLFKGLPLNRRVHWLTHVERLGEFRHEFYCQYFSGPTPLAGRARERWEGRIPPAARTQETAEAVFEVEARRTFPLCYEGDNQQRLVPQRLAGWCPPFVDRDVMDVYCRIPYSFKLNRSLFRKVTAVLTPGLAVADANTGVPPSASSAHAWVRVSQRRLQRKWRRLRGSTFTDESWPDWRHYVEKSPLLEALWNRPNPDALELFGRVLGPPNGTDDLPAVRRIQPYLFVRLLTAKLWLDQRT